MEVLKVDHMFFFSTFRLCDSQAKQRKEHELYPKSCFLNCGMWA